MTHAQGYEMKSSLHAYRVSATEGATHLDVLLACYDALAEDIRLAGRAAAAGDIAERCRHSQHAMLLLGHLQDWVSLLESTSLAESLSSFYDYLREALLRLQASVEATEFTALAMTVCETRAMWQRKKTMMLSPEVFVASDAPSGNDVAAEGRRLYCSA